MKKLPIGIQSIEKILSKEKYLYVDKTLFAKKLIEEEGHFFLSRPRRFGKSLFLDTLKQILLGKKTLFKNCKIYQSDYRWDTFFVMHFSFSKINYQSPEQLVIDLQDAIAKIADEHTISLQGSSLEFKLTYLIEKLGEKKPVVILVDEYDKPILDHLENISLAEANRKILKSFFTVLKDVDKYIKFTFITGISRFSKASLFSGLNNLEDISLDSRYAEVMGYTQKEIEFFFKGHLEYLLERKNTQIKKIWTKQDILQEMRIWYNGYNFSKEVKKVFNPFSILLYFKKEEATSHWYSTGTPSFLIKQICKLPHSIPSLSGFRLHENALGDISDINQFHIAALMVQTGYLTLESYDPNSNIYRLDFPNQEVRVAFFQSLLEHFSPPSSESFGYTKELQEAFEKKENCNYY